MHRDEKNNSASQNFTCLIIVFRALCEQEKERKTDNSNNAFSDKQHNLMMDWHEIGWCLYERGMFEPHSYITYLFVYGLSLWFLPKKLIVRICGMCILKNVSSFLLGSKPTRKNTNPNNTHVMWSYHLMI